MEKNNPLDTLTMQELVTTRPDLVRDLQRAPDIDALCTQYLPQPGEMLSVDDFQNRGIELIQGTKHRFIVLGHLAKWGWDNLFRGLEQVDFEVICGGLWGCHRTTINKAMSVAGYSDLLPEDMSTTLAYTLISAAEGDRELVNFLFDQATRLGWSTTDAQEIIYLRKAGLLNDWVLPKLVYKSNGSIAVRVNGSEQIIAWVEPDLDGLAGAGLALLRKRGKC